MDTERTERIDLLILARLAGPLKKPPLVGQVREDLARFADARWSASEWRERFDERLAALRERGDLMTARLAITDAGRARVAAALGVDPVPDWRTLKRWILPAVALGLAPGAARVRERLKDHLNGLVLQRAHRLGEPGLPTKRQVMDALVWRQLGVETTQPLSLKAIHRHFLGQLLESETRLEPEKILDLLAARAAGASRHGADPLREALVRRWLERRELGTDEAPGTDEAAGTGEAPPVQVSGHGPAEAPGEPDEVPAEAPGAPAEAPDEPDEVPGEPARLFGTHADRTDAVPSPISGPTDRTAPASIAASIAAPTDQTAPARIAEPTDRTAPMPAPGFDLAAFAREVQAVADREQEGRFGTRKVFIAAVWRRLRDTAVCAGMDLTTFQRHLVDANRADLLALHRADLVPMMDPEEVKASEILYGNASFHFIESPFVRR